MATLIHLPVPPYQCADTLASSADFYYYSKQTAFISLLHEPRECISLSSTRSRSFSLPLSLSLNLCQWLATCCGVVSGRVEHSAGCCCVDRITAPQAQKVINMKQSLCAVAPEHQPLRSSSLVNRSPVIQRERESVRLSEKTEKSCHEEGQRTERSISQIHTQKTKTEIKLQLETFMHRLQTKTNLIHATWLVNFSEFCVMVL